MVITIPKVAEALAKEALPKLRLLHDRGVDTTILVSEEFEEDILKSLARVAKVKVKKGLFGGGIISDKRYVVLLLGEELGTTGSKEAVPYGLIIQVLLALPVNILNTCLKNQKT